LCGSTCGHHSWKLGKKTVWRETFSTIVQLIVGNEEQFSKLGTHVHVFYIDHILSHTQVNAVNYMLISVVLFKQCTVIYSNVNNVMFMHVERVCN